MSITFNAAACFSSVVRGGNPLPNRRWYSTSGKNETETTRPSKTRPWKRCAAAFDVSTRANSMNTQSRTGASSSSAPNASSLTTCVDSTLPSSTHSAYVSSAAATRSSAVMPLVSTPLSESTRVGGASSGVTRGGTSYVHVRSLVVRSSSFSTLGRASGVANAATRRRPLRRYPSSPATAFAPTTSPSSYSIHASPRHRPLSSSSHRIARNTPKDETISSNSSSVNVEGSMFPMYTFVGESATSSATTLRKPFSNTVSYVPLRTSGFVSGS